MLDRIFDCNNDIFKYVDDINVQYHLHHHLHLINTGLNKEDLIKILPLLGFTENNIFTEGGRASHDVQEKWVVDKLLRNMDYYPKEYYLLPNTEIQYSKRFPKNVLLYVENSTIDEGRIFLHKISDIEKLLKDINVNLYNKIKHTGLKIVNGFLSENDEHKKINFMKSWQELTCVKDINTALSILSKEYNSVYLKGTTIICESFIEGFKTYNNKEYINIPRIAMTEPSIENGFREFLFRDNVKFTKEENDILLEIYHDTKIGGDMNNGDIYLFNNVTVGHSRESYSNENRKILVSMSEEFINNSIDKLPYLEHPIPSNGDIKYTSPFVETQINTKFSALTYNLNNKNIDKDNIKDILKYYKRYGYLQIINSPYKNEIPYDILNLLGFSKEEQFKWGGKDSGRTVRYSKGNGFHSVDKYPADLMLLPHQEIFYQRVLPKNILFHYRKVLDEGGVTMVHSGLTLLEMIKNENLSFYNKLKKYGQSIITGFLDEHNTQKENNFVRSWQDRFNTLDTKEALINCANQKTHFDKCWMKDDMLMTEITISLFKEYGETYMMFPRISYDKPSIINGYRKFIIGNGEEFSKEELSLLLKCFYYTREALVQKEGDILLVDNIKFGHSRGPYIDNSERDVAVIMSGEFISDNL